MKQLIETIRNKLQKWSVYTKAYSNNISWPITLYFRQPLFKQIATSAIQSLARGLILDVGTGPGHLPIELARNSPSVHVIGIDIALELLNDGIKGARKKHLDERITFLRANVESLPFANDTFEMVQSIFSFHLWNNRQSGIKEIYRVLKPGGQVNILVGRSYLLRGLANFTDYFTKRSISSIKQMCLVAGFKDVKIKGASRLNIIVKK